ncbi:transcriptional regulator, GntR family [Tistlia consotensis]|uniref:Transcriptional regulator, GntR family n=1 Tax=Tistlia consotensis USBA 355 TaxID=560819 RepID=A0A1Y6BNS3_9PROT|nr:GntR family transcriptional regulator [Tistlia consotensis]SMF12402.1 transcriptional regulator, GntR family [Tistlia consotensis USBA 355]SNR51131.1 transcriptional regulator, GntR family [Tistlia consotensis]
MTIATEGKGALQVAPLARKTLQDEVYREICELILDGGIAPGQQVTIQSLADAFGVSAMPVREALKRLTAAEALTVVSGRTIGIPKLSAERLDDLYRVRIEIEPLAGRWAAGRIDAATLAELRAQLAALEQANRTGDVKAYLRANRAYHFTIYRSAGSTVLLPIIESLWLQISPYFHLLQESGNYRTANQHHAAMLAGLEAGDGPAVEAAIRGDIADAYRVLAGLFG